MNQIIQLFGNMQNFQNRYNQLQQQIGQQGMDPQQIVQNMLDRGQMSQQQFNVCRELANTITGRKM